MITRKYIFTITFKICYSIKKHIFLLNRSVTSFNSKFQKIYALNPIKIYTKQNSLKFGSHVMYEKDFEEQLLELFERVLSKANTPKETQLHKQMLEISGAIDTSYDSYAINTTIPYTIFDINEINEFEKYIILRIFERKDILQMSKLVKSKIIDNILEIFNNVKEHTHSNKVYTCGQYFPRSSFLYFTIVDSGETIPYNVNTYCDNINIKPPSKPLEWAIAPGNTTRQVDTPGGLGLSLLCEFIELNNGRLYIVSGNETYEQNGKDNRHMYMEHSFPGTIVTVAFNLLDDSMYRMNSELPEIVF